MKRSIINIFIIGSLLILGLLNQLIYLRSGEFTPLSLTIRGKASNLTPPKQDELLSGDIVRGLFYSNYQNLSTISVRFYNMDRDSDDTLIFRLKESGQNGWLYQAKYKTDQFYPHELFPFGFPVIKDSNNKTYLFEIESLYGTTGHGIFIDYKAPVFLAKFHFEKNILLQNPDLMKYFLVNKFFNIFGGIDNSYLFVNFLPLLLFIIYLLSSDISYQVPFVLTGLLVAFDVFKLKGFNLIFYFGVSLFWILSSIRYKISSKISMTLATLMLIIVAFYSTINTGMQCEKVALWVNIFIICAIIQQIYVNIFKPSGQISVKSFILDFSQIKYSKQTIPKYKLHNYLKYFTISISILLITSTLTSIFGKLTVFREFYPSDYIIRYLKLLLLPEGIIIVLTLITFYLLNRHHINRYLLILILSFSLFFLSSKTIYHAIEFDQYPRIISITPNVVNEVWTDVVVSGKNFRDIPFIGKILINDIEQGEYMLYWSDEKIIFRTSPDLTQSGDVQVIPLDRKPSNKLPFVYSYK